MKHDSVEEAVETLCNQLSLTEFERGEIHMDQCPLEDVLEKGKKCLVVKLHTNRPFNREAFKAIIKKIWRPVISMKFHKLGM